MRHHLLRPVLTAALVLGPGACAPGLGGGSAAPTPTSEVLFQVNNHNWSDVTVYLMSGGARTRLGMVTSMNQRIFKVPGGLLTTTADIRLLLDPIGSTRGYLTEPIMVSPGQTVEMNVENNLRLTSWAVW